MGNSGKHVDCTNSGDPGSMDRQLDSICDAAFSVSGASGFRPWEFVFVRGDRRRLLGEILSEAARRHAPHAPRANLQSVGANAMLAPLIVALGANVRSHRAVPEVEQMLAVGAIAMNILNAVHALGYGALWAAGVDNCDCGVLKALGFRNQVRLVGFVFVGPPGNAGIPTRRQYWSDIANS